MKWGFNKKELASRDQILVSFCQLVRVPGKEMVHFGKMPLLSIF
jgi:hypothetical protein